MTELEQRPMWTALDAGQRAVAQTVWTKITAETRRELQHLAVRSDTHPVDLFLTAVVIRDPRSNTERHQQHHTQPTQPNT